MPRIYVTDPRDPDREAELPVHFAIDSYGEAPSGYGRDFDPGAGPEVRILFALDVCNIDVIPFMAPDQMDAIEAEIRERFDFAADRREARDAQIADLGSFPARAKKLSPGACVPSVV